MSHTKFHLYLYRIMILREVGRGPGVIGIRKQYMAKFEGRKGEGVSGGYCTKQCIIHVCSSISLTFIQVGRLLGATALCFPRLFFITISKYLKEKKFH